MLAICRFSSFNGRVAPHHSLRATRHLPVCDSAAAQTVTSYVELGLFSGSVLRRDGSPDVRARHREGAPQRR